MSKRKDFEPWKVEVVYNKQEGICAKEDCGNSLAYGFHRHHKDGKASNNSVDNLSLQCPRCHGGEAFKSLITRKERYLEETDAILEMAKSGKMSGALADKLTDLIKLGLSLSSQVHGYEVEKPPASIRIKNQLLTSGALLERYEAGYRDGMRIGSAMKVATITPIIEEKIKLESILKRMLPSKEQLENLKNANRKGKSNSTKATS